jgi:hypothetical protein
VTAAPLRSPRPPAAGYEAVFGEAEFADGDLVFTLSTPVRILEPKK